MQLSKLLNYKFLPVFILFFSTTSLAQITSSEIRGMVEDETANPIPGAKIEVLHVPTGFVNNLRSDVNGRYFLPNLKPGGPYTVTVSASTYKDFKQENIRLTLGETFKLNVKMLPVVNELGTVEVAYDKNDAFRSDRMGAQTSLGKDEIGKLPTLNRSLQDMTRVSPQASGNSFVGSNYRYNNLSIDGVANNDAFGFQEPGVGAGGSTAAGSPGALAKTQPISLDAVSEIQVSTSPYDVKLGNFTGGSLNVVTRSGTNSLEGSVYNFYKSNATTGGAPYANRSKIANFQDNQFGFRLGGAAVKNKLFFFVNGEISRRVEPLLFAPGDEGSIFDPNDIQSLYDTIQSRYGYDAGTIGARNLATNSNKAFIRFDYYLNEKHQLIMRHNIVQASHENLSRSGTIMNFGSQGFTHNSLTNSTVAELKSRIGTRMFNNLIVGWSTIDDRRDPFGELFPHIEISYNSAGTIFLGSYREASIFQMKQKSYELSDNLTLFADKHKFTFGTHNEFYDFDYHFVTPYTGRWAYRSIDDFYANTPSRVRGTYHLRDGSYEFNYNRPSADFNVILSSFYAQDEYTVNDRLKLSLGLRAEGNIFLEHQDYAQDLRDHPVFGQFAKPVTTQYIIAPRFGFNYAVNEKNSWKLRGGTGIFAGRQPFAWSAYSHIYSGSQFGSVDIRPDNGEEVELITEDFERMADLQSGKREINLVDPNYKLPRVWRSSVATDVRLPGDITWTIEGIFSKDIYNIFFQNINLKEDFVELQGAGDDNRKIYTGSGDEQRVEADYANVFLLTNTTQGFRYSIATSLEKKFKNGLSMMGAYTYGESKDIMNGVRVSAQANWNWNQTIDPNNPRLSYSNFDVRHRVISAITYEKQWKKNQKTTVSAFFLGSSGSPFSYVYDGDLNRDASSKNDLIYVPRSIDEINLVDYTNASGVVVTAAEQWQQLDAFINGDEYLSGIRGEYAERNGARTPWNVQVDMHLGHEFGFTGRRKTHKFAVTADIFNITNLINYRWGRQYFVPNTTNAGYGLISAKTDADGNATYKFFNPAGDPWNIDGIASRLQMQIGLRYSF